MTKEEAIEAMDAITHGDAEYSHGEAEDIIFAYLRDNGAPELEDAWDRLVDRVGGFWYA